MDITQIQWAFLAPAAALATQFNGYVLVAAQLFYGLAFAKIFPKYWRAFSSQIVAGALLLVVILGVLFMLIGANVKFFDYSIYIAALSLVLVGFLPLQKVSANWTGFLWGGILGLGIATCGPNFAAIWITAFTTQSKGFLKLIAYLAGLLLIVFVISLLLLAMRRTILRLLEDETHFVVSLGRVGLIACGLLLVIR
jgi:cytochrome c biogenesis protein CcdA